MKSQSSIVWEDADYGGGATMAAAGFVGSVSYSLVRGEGFIGRFERWTLKERFDSAEKAKLAVEQFAARKCKQLAEAVRMG